MHPDFLIMDEPSAGLDPVGRMEIFSRVKELKGLWAGRASGNRTGLRAEGSRNAAVRRDSDQGAAGKGTGAASEKGLRTQKPCCVVKERTDVN